jgi:hypothetical protein
MDILHFSLQEAKTSEEKATPEEEKTPEETKKEEAGGETEKKEGGGGEKVEKAEAPPPPPEEVVMRVYMHCEGCARKVKRCLKGFEGTLQFFLKKINNIGTFGIFLAGRAGVLLYCCLLMVLAQYAESVFF